MNKTKAAEVIIQALWPGPEVAILEVHSLLSLPPCAVLVM